MTAAGAVRASPYAVARQRVLEMLPKGGVGAEIGVWKGDFSAAILHHANPSHLTLIDPWQTKSDASYANAWYGSAKGVDMDVIFAGVRQRFADERARGVVTLHRGTAKDAPVAPESLDFVYVDGDHSYHAVRQDLEHALTWTKPGGLICADDYRLGGWWGDGVVRAVNGFLGDHADTVMLRVAIAAQVVIARR